MTLMKNKGKWKMCSAMTPVVREIARREMTPEELVADDLSGGKLTEDWANDHPADVFAELLYSKGVSLMGAVGEALKG